MEGLKDVLLTTKADHVVISNEALSNERIAPERIKEFLDEIVACQFQPVVVAFVRPQVDLVNSEYAQIIQSLRGAMNFTRYCKVKVRDGHYRWTSRLAPWANHAKAAFIPLPFNQQFRRPDLAAAVLRLAGIPAPRVESAALPALLGINQSFGPLAVAATRYSRPRLIAAGLPLDAKLRAIVRHQATDRGWNVERFFGFGRVAADAFGAAFEEDNEAFAQRFWNGSWRAHFPDEERRERNEINLLHLSSGQLARFDDFAEDVIAACTS